MSHSISWKFCPSCGEKLPPKVSHSDPMLLQSCSCGFQRYDNPVPVVAGLIELPEGIVLVHAKNWPKGAYGLVSGFIEQGESPQDAIIREVKEELGLNAVVDHFIGYYSIPSMGEMVITFALNAPDSIQLGDELDDFKIIPREKLRSWDFGTGPAVRDWLALHNRGLAQSQPIMNVLELFGRRWALRILWELSERGILGFRELCSVCGGLSPDTMSTRLKDLIAVDLIDNIDDSGSYELTDKARELRPHLIGIAKWANSNQKDGD